VKAYSQRAALGLLAAGLSCALLLPLPAAAHLGGDSSSVDADRHELRATLRSIPMQQFQLHEISAPSGTLVYEYATPQGTVFAVTWHGPLPPDLHQLFGSYYPRYQAAAAAHARPGMHRQVNIVDADLVVQSTARLRAFGGLAYIPSLMPAGVSVANLQ
jgi:hypothetical protein